MPPTSMAEQPDAFLAERRTHVRHFLRCCRTRGPVGRKHRKGACGIAHPEDIVRRFFIYLQPCCTERSSPRATHRLGTA